MSDRTGEEIMRVGVPKEIKKNEHRVGLTPTAVREYVARGHTVAVQAGAGIGAGFTDTDFKRAGAKIVSDAATVYRGAFEYRTSRSEITERASRRRTT